jgi:hypothetical protein
VGTSNGDRPDWIAFLKQWYRRNTSISHRFGKTSTYRAIRGISFHIWYLYNRATHYGTACRCVLPGWHWKNAVKSVQSFSV